MRQESRQMLEIISKYQKAHHQPSPIQLKNYLHTWRDRLPNEWEGIPVWNDIVSWRNQLFAFVMQRVPSSLVHSSPLLHDTPWTTIKLAQIARKHQLTAVALTSLAQLFG